VLVGDGIDDVALSLQVDEVVAGERKGEVGASAIRRM